MNSLLAELRAVVPNRRLSLDESLVLAERQAELLLRLRDVGQGPVSVEVIANLPFVRVATRRPMAPAAATRWVAPHWVVLLNADHPSHLQRHSLAHEFKHILDHPHVTAAGGQPRRPRCHAYAVCEYFALCLQVPKRWLRQAWTHGVQDLVTLADLFDVSVQTIETRLHQIGLVDSASCREIDDN